MSKETIIANLTRKLQSKKELVHALKTNDPTIAPLYSSPLLRQQAIDRAQGEAEDLAAEIKSLQPVTSRTSALS